MSARNWTTGARQACLVGWCAFSPAEIHLQRVESVPSERFPDAKPEVRLVVARDKARNGGDCAQPCRSVWVGPADIADDSSKGSESADAERSSRKLSRNEDSRDRLGSIRSDSRWCKCCKHRWSFDRDSSAEQQEVCRSRSRVRIVVSCAPKSLPFAGKRGGLGRTCSWIATTRPNIGSGTGLCAYQFLGLWLQDSGWAECEICQANSRNFQFAIIFKSSQPSTFLTRKRAMNPKSDPLPSISKDIRKFCRA